MILKANDYKKRAVLSSSLWLGSIGSLLIVGGICALLASNWVKIPFVVQVVLAFFPLILGWIGYAWLVKKAVRSSVFHEILGIVWSGGVVSSIALLGRILQLTSSEFLFCTVVTLLLLPVVCAVRSTAAWIVMLGFAISGASDFPGGKQDFLIFELSKVGLLVTAAAVILLRLRTVWSDAECYSRFQHRLIGVAAPVWALTLSCNVSECLGLILQSDNTEKKYISMLSLLVFNGLLLTVGVLTESKSKLRSRAVTKSSATACCIIFMAATASFDNPCELNIALVCAMIFVIFVLVLCVFRKKLLLNEGIFLLLVPIGVLNFFIGIQLLCLMLGLGVGIGLIVIGIMRGHRIMANEGLAFAIIDSIVMFVTADAPLSLQGIFLVTSGICSIVLNIFIAKINGKRESA